MTNTTTNSSADLEARRPEHRAVAGYTMGFQIGIWQAHCADCDWEGTRFMVIRGDGNERARQGASAEALRHA